MTLNTQIGKMAARPSHQAIETPSEDAIDDFKSEQEKLDRVAMRAAKRAQNRIIANEQSLPGSTIFTK